jgi:hypothetical protein
LALFAGPAKCRRGFALYGYCALEAVIREVDASATAFSFNLGGQRRVAGVKRPRGKFARGHGRRKDEAIVAIAADGPKGAMPNDSARAWEELGLPEELAEADMASPFWPKAPHFG